MTHEELLDYEMSELNYTCCVICQKVLPEDNMSGLCEDCMYDDFINSVEVDTK